MVERFYRELYRIRRVEEEIARIYPSDKIKSPVHLAIGQEAASVGVCAALRPDDVVFGYYRSHALYLAKGGDLNRMMAELYGKGAGCTKGKGGSMHLIDASAGVMGTSAVVGTGIPPAVGYAWAARYREKDTIVASFFGDGAVEEGAFHESMNYAALEKLPILFVCENNFYAIHTHLKFRQPRDDIAERARAYGMRAERIEDDHAAAIHERAREAVETMRAEGKGPWFLETRAYRWMEHVGPNRDFDKGYRDEREARPWIENDPVKRAGAELSAEARERIEREVEAEIAESIRFAEDSPLPADEELLTDLY